MAKAQDHGRRSKRATDFKGSLEVVSRPKHEVSLLPDLPTQVPSAQKSPVDGPLFGANFLQPLSLEHKPIKFSESILPRN